MIVTDQPIMRDGLRLLVGRQPDMRVVGESAPAAQVLRDLLELKPDIAIIDLQRPPGACLKMLNAIRAISPLTPLLILANYPEGIVIPSGPGQGPTGVLGKLSASREVIPAVRRLTR
jgi:DNA-binding NarL/FixJ family response regulator